MELKAIQFDKHTQFLVASVLEGKQNDWTDYLRGANIELEHKYLLHIGMCGVIDGRLPIGGLPFC